MSEDRHEDRSRRSEEDHLAAARQAVVAAALPHVAFDGWTDRTLAHAVEDAGVDPGLSRLAFPRGGVDLALAYPHGQGRRSSPGAWRRPSCSACGFATGSPMR